MLRRVNDSRPWLSAPLNRGLIRWFRTGARTNGGLYWRNLIGATTWLGTFNGGAAIRSGYGRQGNARAVFCDGTDDYIQLSTIPFTAAPFTLAYWHRPTSLAGVAWWCGEGGAGTWRAFYQGVNADGSTGFVAVQNNVFAPAAGTPPGLAAAGAWHHIVCVATSSTSRQAWCNGRSTGVATDASTPSGLNEFYLGCERANASRGNFSNGLFDDLRIYNRALTEAEVQRLYLASRTNYAGECQSLLLPVYAEAAAYDPALFVGTLDVPSPQHASRWSTVET